MKKSRNFELLMGGLIDEGPRDLPEGKEITDEEVTVRANIFLNGYRVVEKAHRKIINDISFQLNRKFAKGCQARELIESYNVLIGRFQDDFIF